ncbi:MAG: Crp/Fnr family transcriptional regulator [Veillonella sp.]|uniref:Crp/Fnr family transcriptional regulator n=1 Tax=Veillonella sp. TaxID=1926307 RepID=UPI0025E416F5|nr:Crp/Fnr family transcriptional regulator [Veillonella sp.]MBS4912937.1 Crp/Fnr family transcriptional regulator [Veillonella sp.]
MSFPITDALITQHLATLLASPLFNNLSEDQLRHFLSEPNLYIESYKKNSFVAIAGEPMEGIGILLTGHVHLTRENILGQRSIMTELTPSSMFGEAILFTDMPNWPATLETTKDSEVLFVPKTAFTSSFNHNEAYQVQILTNLLHDMSEKALALTRKVHYLSLKGMRERIFAYLNDMYQRQKKNPLTLPHNRQEMADVLNVSRTALSRELGRLQDEHIIELSGKQVHILQIETVREYAF